MIKFIREIKGAVLERYVVDWSLHKLPAKYLLCRHESITAAVQTSFFLCAVPRANCTEIRPPPPLAGHLLDASLCVKLARNTPAGRGWAGHQNWDGLTAPTPIKAGTRSTLGCACGSKGAITLIKTWNVKLVNAHTRRIEQTHYCFLSGFFCFLELLPLFLIPKFNTVPHPSRLKVKAARFLLQLTESRYISLRHTIRFPRNRNRPMRDTSSSIAPEPRRLPFHAAAVKATAQRLIKQIPRA